MKIIKRFNKLPKLEENVTSLKTCYSPQKSFKFGKRKEIIKNQALKDVRSHFLNEEDFYNPIKGTYDDPYLEFESNSGKHKKLLNIFMKFDHISKK